MPGPKVLLYLLILISGISTRLYSQQVPPVSNKGFQFTGTVIDSVTSKPIEMATVTLLNTAGKTISGITTNASGIFTLNVTEADNYWLAVTFIGYKPYKSASFKWPGHTGSFVIRLPADIGQLNEVTVARRKALLQNKGDKIIYNASADISNKAGSATDVLRKVPMLTVGPDGEVRMRGSSNIKVLLNGVASGIMARNLKEALKMIPASTIVSIEVITSPSAKYEAEGAGGIINIITTKKVKGKDGNIDITGGNLEQSVSGGLNIATEKLDFGVNLSGRRETQRNDFTLERESLNEGKASGHLFQRSDSRTQDKSGTVDLKFGYRPDSSQRLSTAISFWHGSWPTKSNLYNLYRDKTNTAEYNQASHQTGNYNWAEFNINYQKKFSRKSQELELQALYTNTGDKTAYETQQFNLSGAPIFKEKSPNRGKDNRIDAQADYTHPLNSTGKHLLEIGSRYSRSNSSSVYSVFNNEANPNSDNLTEVPSRSGNMKYYREVIAAYISLKFVTSNNWMFKPGVRYENTRIGADFASQSPSFVAKFNNVVPSILLTKQLNELHSFKLHYIERIRRPWIWDLNPYVNASDPRNLTYGNPQLKPEVTRMFEFGHNYDAASGFSLNSSIYFNINNNAIESITTVDSLGISRTTSQNIAANNRLGVNINASIPINSNWTLTAGAELYHVKFKSKALNIGNNANFFAFNINSSYELPRDYSIQLSGDYSNGYITLQGRSSANYSYRIAVQKELMKKKASIMLGMSNPFQKTLREYSRSTAPSFQSLTINNYYVRAITLSFNWKFGSISKSKEEGEERETTEREGMPQRRR